MGIKDIKEAIEKEKVFFGVKQAIKNKKKISNVFVAKDVREETIDKLEKAGIEFVVLKPKEELKRELNMDFGCEVFSII